MKKLILSVAAALLTLGGLRAQEQDPATGVSEWLTSYSALVVDAPLDIRLVQIPASEAPKSSTTRRVPIRNSASRSRTAC